MTEWWAGGGIVGMGGVAALLIFRLVRLGVNQEARLLTPCYDRVDLLEKRLEAVERKQRDCDRRLAHALYLLRFHNIEFEEGAV